VFDESDSCSRSFVSLPLSPISEPQIPNFTAENRPADGESPTQDGDADGESHLADGDSPRKNAADAADGDFPNSKIIDNSALAIYAAGYEPPCGADARNHCGRKPDVAHAKPDEQLRPPTDQGGGGRRR
jgi:hypothetical protein